MSLLLFIFIFASCAYVDLSRSELLPNDEGRSTNHRDEKLLFGNKATTTYTDFSIVTSEVFFSCLVGTAEANVCAGRRKKRKISIINIKSFGDNLRSGDLPFDSSLVERDVDQLHSSKGDGRFLGITLWTTQRVTSKITLLSTNTATTIRLSYYCKAGNINLPAFNCNTIPAR